MGEQLDICNYGGQTPFFKAFAENLSHAKPSHAMSKAAKTCALAKTTTRRAQDCTGSRRFTQSYSGNVSSRLSNRF